MKNFRLFSLAVGAAVGLTVAVLPGSAHASSAGLPVMGVNTWYIYRTNASEANVLNEANMLERTGLAAKGYDYVGLDDGWMLHHRTSSGALSWDPAKFPDGIPALANQLHGMGLKLGIYTAIGTQTCQRYPGSWGHYAQDAQTFADWGVDLVKVDDCGGLPSWATEATVSQDFQQFGADLANGNGSIVYDEELPVPYIGTSGFVPAVRASAGMASSWRVAYDESPLNSAQFTIFSHLSADWYLHGYAGPGHWNNLDMLLTGNPRYGWSLAQEESQLSVWAEESSPLLVSASVGALSAAELAALGNRHLIAIDQSGAQAAAGISSGHIEGLVKPDPEGGKAVLLANPSGSTASATFRLSQLGIGSRSVHIYNIWTGRTISAGSLRVTLGAGQTELLRVY